MSSESPAFANQASSYGAEQTRRAVFLPFSSAGGVKASGDLAVTAPVSGMTCNVATGEVLVPGSSSAVQGLYYGRVSSTTNVAIAASNPSNPRIDMIYAAITDSAYTGATNTFVPAAATGTPTVGATLVNLTGAPALPTSAIILAYVLVPATSTSVTTPNISDQRVRFVVSNAASLVSSSTQAFTGNVSTPALIVTGLTGAITQARYPGGTASGAPVSGTFNTTDVVPDSTGKLWICTAGGSPGTWVSVGAAFMGCRLTLATTQAISTTTVTSILFDAETYDVGGLHSLVTNTNRVTVPTGGAGKFSVKTNVQFAPNATGRRTLVIRLNGTIVKVVELTTNTGGGLPTGGVLVDSLALADADWVDVQVNQSSGGNLNLEGDSVSVGATSLVVERIGT